MGKYEIVKYKDGLAYGIFKVNELMALFENKKEAINFIKDL